MKISHSELVQIIKEEVAAYKKVKLLENRKREILNLLREMEECGTGMYEDTMEEGSDEMVDEILSKLFGKSSPEQKKEEMKNFINNHPVYKFTAEDVAEKFNKDENMVFEKLVDFFTKEGTLVDGNKKITGIKSFMFDPNNNVFVNKTKVSAPYGPTSGKGEL